MQTSHACLSAQHLARLKTSLAQWHANRGAILLGSQLGQLIRDAIHPLTIKSCGGMKALAERDLTALVAWLPEQTSSDIRYRILVPAEASSSEFTVSETIEDEHEISGIQLWRLFANPRLTPQLAASNTGEIVVAPSEHTLSAGKNLLRKLTSEDYRILAGQFAASWSDNTTREQMQEALKSPEFYNDWIDALRRSRTTDLNPLKQWEITRAEHIARRLGEELVAAGVDGARAAEIVATARPSNTPRVNRVTADTTLANAAHVKQPETYTQSSRSIASDTLWMREMLHLAIDKMDLTELLEIRVPAGLLLEVSRQRRT